MLTPSFVWYPSQPIRRSIPEWAVGRDKRPLCGPVIRGSHTHSKNSRIAAAAKAHSFLALRPQYSPISQCTAAHFCSNKDYRRLPSHHRSIIPYVHNMSDYWLFSLQWSWLSTAAFTIAFAVSQVPILAFCVVFLTAVRSTYYPLWA